MFGPSAVLSAVVLGPHDALTHSLPTAGLVLGLDGPLTVGHRGRTHRASTFALGADTPHAGAALGNHLIVLLDDRHSLGRALSTEYPGVHGELPWMRDLREAVIARAAEIERPGVLLALLDERLRRAAVREDWRAPRLDARVERAVEVIDDAVSRGVSRPRPLIAGVSPPHLRALFKRDLGRTISRHTRQRRLLVAMAGVGSGASATGAAHDAGFADAAHLSRTVRAAFGTTLRALGRDQLHIAGR